jgi:hypothetical protein
MLQIPPHRFGLAFLKLAIGQVCSDSPRWGRAGVAGL